MIERDDQPDNEWTAETMAAVAMGNARERVLPAEEWALHQPLIDEIKALKVERKAVVLAHNYQTPEIFHGVADLSGDSLALAQMAAQTDAEVIVLCGVHFMAETAKILNPGKTVLIPDLRAGCSLADSITAADVRLLKQRHPGVPVVTYVNTSAAVKAETDICCTSANALAVVESLDSDQVIFLPDRYLGHWVASQTSKQLILWEGACEVHERFSARQIRGLRADQPIHVLAHPECPPDVLAEADYVGSTSGMIHHLKAVRPARVALITECSMSDNVAIELPEIEFVRPCNLCPHMKRITLANIRDALLELRYMVNVPAEIIEPARRAVQRMLDLGRSQFQMIASQQPR